ncbi:MAG: hypothetical protein ABIJ82_03850 [Patescibacteria group bacterium]
MKTKIEFQSEMVLSKEPAKVKIFNNRQLVATIIAKIEYQQGADGGQYPCVVFVKPAKIPVVSTLQIDV